MNPQSIPQIKRVIRSLDVREARSFVREALKKKTARGVFELSRDTFGGTLAEVTFS
jgi:phosphoenolpyruvate-protein kinase (PTS system EI component)